MKISLYPAVVAGACLPEAVGKSNLQIRLDPL